jgi:methionyl-tRNA synthetase
LVDKYGIDAVRYYLLRGIPSSEDGDFSIEKFEELYNADLANGLGNLVARVLALAVKNKIQLPNEIKDKEITIFIEKTKKGLEKLIKEFEFNRGLGEIWKLVSFCNSYIDKTKPWELTKGGAKGNIEGIELVLSNLIYCISEIADLIESFLPETSEKIKKQLKSNKPEILFPRLDKTK